MTRLSKTIFLSLAASTLLLSGCNREGEFSPVDMWNRSRYKPLEAFEQGGRTSTSQQLPPGTVYRGQVERDRLYPASENGMSVRKMQEVGRQREDAVTPGNVGPTGDYRIRGGAASMTEFPFPVTKVVMERGRERYDVYCAPCHGRTGMGDGMIVRRGFSQPPTYHQERLREAPVGHYFDVITNGYGAMYPYADKLSPEDRWAVIAYIRALQLSQNGRVEDVPENERANIGVPRPPKYFPSHGTAGDGHGAGHSDGAGGLPGDTTFDSSPTRPDTGGHTGGAHE